MTTRATPVAPALRAVDHSAANPLAQEPSRHGSSGLAATPLLGARLCWVYPTLYRWPPVSGAAQAIQRAAIVSLLGGALLPAGHGSPADLIAPPTPGVAPTRWLQEVTVR
jgi:hypothetical protein